MTALKEIKTQAILGHSITLHRGTRYIACRQMIATDEQQEAAELGLPNFKVVIQTQDEWRPVWEVRNLSCDEADAFLSKFNDDPRGSLYGRTW